MRTYSYPADMNVPVARLEAAARRSALVAAGCCTYIMGWRNGLPRITCCCCGLGSQNSHDIKEKWCGFCNSWHSEWDEQMHKSLLGRAGEGEESPNN